MSWADNEYATIIKHAQIDLQGNEYVLNAEMDYHLSPVAKAALLKGIALSWTIPVVLQQRRDYLWNKDLLRFTLRYQVQYFALLNVYRVKAEHSGQVNHFATLAAALNSIAVINALKLRDKNQLSAKQTYQVRLKVSFEREALPIPLRPIAYFDQQWYLSSDWFFCVF
ncbi:MAG: DUF4390 domain-containing protein [Methylococcaceae bacterium]|nr:DUF4390 domain-containing protein [Methylococcaceae bacterium]